MDHWRKVVFANKSIEGLILFRMVLKGIVNSHLLSSSESDALFDLEKVGLT